MISMVRELNNKEKLARFAADYLASAAGGGLGVLSAIPGAGLVGQQYGPEVIEAVALSLAGRNGAAPMASSGSISGWEPTNYQKVQELIKIKMAFEEGYAAAKGVISPNGGLGPRAGEAPKQKRKVSRVQKAFGREMKAIKKKDPKSYQSGRNKKKLMRLAWAAVNKKRKKEKW